MERTRQALREWILTGELRPGEPVNQVHVASRLGVSRGPLREALRLLEREGFVVQEHNHRARVAEFSLTDWDQLSAMRIALEPVAVALSVPRLTDADHARLAELLKEMDQTSADISAWEQHHRDFHRILLSHAGARFANECEHLSDHSARYRRVFAGQESREWKGHRTREHELIAEAARRGDGESAATMTAEHLARTAVVAIGAMDPGYEPAAVRRALCLVTGADTRRSGDTLR